jgi:hypothetical protein
VRSIQRPVINERGEVALTIQRPGNVEHAAVWWRGRLRAETTVGASAGDINDRGVVVGLGQGAAQFQAIVWRRGRVEVLPRPEGFDYSGAGSVNNRGQILGSAGLFDYSRYQALVWQDGPDVALAPLPGDESAMFSGPIDDRGQVPGLSWTTTPTGEDRGTAVLWTVTG